MEIAVGVFAAIVLVVAGILIGRKNPSVSDDVKKFTDAVKAAAEKDKK